MTNSFTITHGYKKYLVQDVEDAGFDKFLQEHYTHELTEVSGVKSSTRLISTAMKGNAAVFRDLQDSEYSENYRLLLCSCGHGINVTNGELILPESGIV